MSFAASIRDQLVKVFTPAQADVLAECVVRANDTLATRSDMHDLQAAMTALAEAEARTEYRLEQLTESHERLTDAQSRTESRLEQLTESHERLAEAQSRTESRLEQLAKSHERLAEAQSHTESRLEQLAVAQSHTDSRLDQLTVTVADLTTNVQTLNHTVADLTTNVQTLNHTVGNLTTNVDTLNHTVAGLTTNVDTLNHTVAGLTTNVDTLNDTVRTLGIRTDKTAGWALEWLVGNRLPAYVGRVIKRCKVVGPLDVIDGIEARIGLGHFTEGELDDLRRTDVIATGTVDNDRLYLVGEVSFKADNDDVLRAARRAALLAKAGERTQPFVACDAIDPIPAELARREGVWVIVDGKLLTSAA
jgi:predicted  nucleic acid-binding Zn-ribbon protein